MNYSDYDSEDYSSDQDRDYVPSDDNLSEDDINECEKEDPINEDDDVPHPDNGKKRKRKDIRAQKLKMTVEEGEAKETQLPQEEKDNEDEETKHKKKSDDLWASFLSDVGSRPKESQSSPTAQAASEQEVSAEGGEMEPSGPAMVTITKVFDFAGEEVRVNKKVSADSREAKSFLKNQNIEQEDNETKEKNATPSQPPLPGPSAKRPAGMSNILSRMGGKKQKMSTLEKSKMDWDAFKSEEGITEELAIHNRGKEGYVERKNFLERVDHRRFELEKAVRLSNMKR
ncbi:craniofacial development protein 1 [Xenentodon cancila]